MSLINSIRELGLTVVLAMPITRLATMMPENEVAIVMEIQRGYTVHPRRRPTVIGTWRDVVDAANLPTDDREHVVIVCTDHDNRIIGNPKLLAIGSRDKLSICKQQIYDYTASIRAVNAYIVHNHPRGGHVSGMDVKFTFDVRDILSRMNCTLVQHLVVRPIGVEDVVSGTLYYLSPCDEYVYNGNDTLCVRCGHDKTTHRDWIENANNHAE